MNIFMDLSFFQSCEQCNFPKDPTTVILFFEYFTIVATAILLPLLIRLKKITFSRYLTILIGVFVFEFFTQPLWHSYYMGKWAYVYYDVSWILTLGWTGLITLAIVAGNHFFSKAKESKRFFAYLAGATVLGLLGETWVVGIGIRTYSPEVVNTLSNINIPFLGLPIEALYYIPVFMSLVIGFYKYWDLYLSKKLIVPVNKGNWVRNFIITIIGVLLYEIMIEPMVINANLPEWSYIYRDVSFLITLGWVALIYFSIFIVDRFMVKQDLVKKFVAYLIVLTTVAIPIENLLVKSGIRQYSESLTNNFMGPVIPGTVLAVEVLLAIPLYLALVIAFVRYWQIVFDNHY